MNLFLDIETICDQSEGAFEEILSNIEPPGQYKKEESIQKWKDTQGREAAEEAYLKTALHGISGEICSIAWAIDDGEVESLTLGVDDKFENALIHSFFYDLGKLKFNVGEGKYPRLTWIGHNILNFDLRFLKQRCLINNIRPPFIIPADAKHGGDSVFDTMLEWSGWKGYVKQKDLCKAFGIEDQEGIDGSEVWDAYQAGRFEEIREHNKMDVEQIRQIYKRMVWE